MFVVRGADYFVQECMTRFECLLPSKQQQINQSHRHPWTIMCKIEQVISRLNGYLKKKKMDDEQDHDNGNVMIKREREDEKRER